MVRRLLAAGALVTVWARRRGAAAAFEAAGAEVAADLGELGRRCEMVGVCVTDDEGVREVVQGLLGAMAPGSSIAVHSTVHPRTITSVAALAAERGIEVLDAPVSGGGGAAAAANLLLLAGGSAALVERWKPLLGAFASKVVPTGPAGSAQVAKVINNALMSAQFLLADDAAELGAALGLDPDVLLGGIGHGSGGSFALGIRRGLGSAAALGPLGGALLHKDVGILASVLDGAGVDGRRLLADAEALFEVMPVAPSSPGGAGTPT